MIETGNAALREKMMRALIVEDDNASGAYVEKILKSAECETFLASNGSDALKAARTEDFAFIVSDVVMPEMSGLEFLETLKKDKPDIPTVFITGIKDFEFPIKAMDLGAIGFIVKPFEREELLGYVQKIETLGSYRKSRKPALRHAFTEEQEILFDTASLMDKYNLLVTATHLAEQFGIKSDRGLGRQIRYGLAVHEALKNAVEFGSLEMPSEMKESEDLFSGSGVYEKLFKSRLSDPAYSSRKVAVSLSRRKDRVSLTIRDEGKGFDHQLFMENLRTNGAPVEKTHGRGLLLVDVYMDKIEFNEAGNEITLIRYVN